MVYFKGTMNIEIVKRAWIGRRQAYYMFLMTATTDTITRGEKLHFSTNELFEFSWSLFFVISCSDIVFDRQYDKYALHCIGRCD